MRAVVSREATLILGHNNNCHTDAPGGLAAPGPGEIALVARRRDRTRADGRERPLTSGGKPLVTVAERGERPGSACQPKRRPTRVESPLEPLPDPGSIPEGGRCGVAATLTVESEWLG